MSSIPETQVRKWLAIKENGLRGGAGGKGNPQAACVPSNGGSGCNTRRRREF